MRQLFWKEWREQRWLPLIMTAVTIVVNGVWAYVAYRINLAGMHGGHHTNIIVNGSHSADDTISPKDVLDGSFGILVALWMLAGTLAGAGGIATEVGTGTLKFLFSLPVKRETLWRVKILTALGTLAATLLLSSLCLFLMDVALYGPHTVHAVWVGSSHNSAAPYLETVLLAFVFAFTASAFVDRTISALLTSVISGPIVYAILLALAEWSLKHMFLHVSSGQSDLATSWLPLFLMGVLGVVSYAVFVHGGSLTTAKRFKVGAIAGGTALLAASAAFMAAAPLLAHGH